MYNTKYVCIYNSKDVFLDTDEVTNSEKDCILNILYRQDILSIFELEDFDEKLLNQSIFELYEKVKMDSKIKKIMIHLSQQMMLNDEKIGFLMMYSFDYLYITHKCISQFLETGDISEENMNEFDKIVNL
jgi:hypothetical protein